jgi:hypothetical protein
MFDAFLVHRAMDGWIDDVHASHLTLILAASYSSRRRHLHPK